MTPYLNTLWMYTCALEKRAFQRSTKNARATQVGLLRGILRNNRDTVIGRQYRFDSIFSSTEFQQRIPLSTYADYEPFIQRIGAGEPHVLTREPVMLLEPTSGSTGGEKLIPYTASLKREFRRGIDAWIGELFSRRPKVRRGRAYWSISPVAKPDRCTPGGIPIGFEDDSDYLAGWTRSAVRRLLVAPGALSRARDIEVWRYCTLLFLLQARDLSLISIWSPTFLTSLLADIPGWRERLCRDIQRGELSPPGQMPSELRTQLSALLRPDPRRARELLCLLRENPERGAYREVWPRLAMISCWTDGAAANYVPSLQALFPEIELQGKGLLATEAFVSFPLAEHPGSALSLRSHFFEFIPTEESVPLNARSSCLLADELEEGREYEVVATTAGGLYRYRLRDRIQVVGRVAECPLIKFLGKTDRVCDLVGEKLSEAFVRRVLDGAATVLQSPRPIMMLVAVAGPPAGYRLYVQNRGANQHSRLDDRFRDAVELGLRANPHYDYARAIGQLQPLRVEIVDELSPARRSRWLGVAEGQKVGNHKPLILLDSRSYASGWDL